MLNLKHQAGAPEKTWDLAVVGGATFDMTGVALDKANLYDSNPSRIFSSPGGVGRNIAENAARLGLRTSFLSAFGTDHFSAALRASCDEVGVDTRHAHIQEGAGSCLYIDLLDRDGELLMAAADCDLIEALPLTRIREAADWLNGHRLLCLDANLSEQALVCAAEQSRIPIIGDTISAAKATRFHGILPRLTAIKTNLLELAALTGVEQVNPERMEEAAAPLLAVGVQQIFVTMGAAGACCIEQAGLTRIDGFSTTVRNVTGAGDAFCAAVAYGLCKGLPTEEILFLGSAMSHLALASYSAVNPAVTEAEALRVCQGLRERRKTQ